MPTMKQARAAIKLVENGGNVSKAMRDAGYSPATAHNPKKLTGTKTWKELLEITFPDEKLTRKVDEGLEAYTYRGRRKVDDYDVRHKYVTTALKLRDKLDEKLKLLGDKDEPLQIVITEAKNTATNE